MTPSSLPTKCLALLPLILGGSLLFSSPVLADPGLAIGASSQDEVPPKKDKHLTEWPALEKAAVKLEIDRLRKARTEEMGESARLALIEMGAGVTPTLLAKYGKERDLAAVERMKDVLEAVTGPLHTRLLAEYFDDKSSIVRNWCLLRVAGFPDSGVREAAEKAHAVAEKRTRDKSEGELLSTALCCASSGSFMGFDYLTKEAKEDWKGSGDRLHVALGALRGKEATARVAKLLESGERAEILCGLRLLAACGDKETAKPVVAPFLDSSDNSLRIGAINALRGIIDGDPPLSKLSVFQAIEEANKWKARI